MLWKNAFRKAIVPGLYAGASMLAVAAIQAREMHKRPVEPINAMSHVLWGDEEASRAHSRDLKHTGTGIAIGLFSTYLWAVLYERLFGDAPRRRNYAKTLGGSAFIAALAYLVDYKLLPRRLTPGWELSLPRSFLPLPYLLMALRLPVRALMKAG